MDNELIAYLDQRFRESAKQIEGLHAEFSSFRVEVVRRFEQIDRRFEQVDEQNRQLHVLLEGLRHEVHLVAEGYMGLNERLQAHQSETLLKFDEVRASIVPYYQDLNRRVLHMEGHVERQTRDVMDVIHERFGKPRSQS